LGIKAFLETFFCTDYLSGMARPREIMKPKRLPVDMDEADLQAFEEIAAAEGKPRARLVREVLQHYISRWKRRQGSEG